VADCAVIGVADERWGEVGRAIVVPSAAAGPEAGPLVAELLDHLSTRLARYKVPRSVVFADELPRSGAGKLLKEELRARYGDPAPPP
jgi:fatty-acyl-CoA synthase